jgi:hypothetical protein
VHSAIAGGRSTRVTMPWALDTISGRDFTVAGIVPDNCNPLLSGERFLLPDQQAKHSGVARTGDPAKQPDG